MVDPEPVEQNQKQDGDLIRSAQRLCEQGRFLETKRRQVEFEREILNQEARKMQAVLASLGTLMKETLHAFDDRLSQLLAISDRISEVVHRVGVRETPSLQSNVRHMSQYLADSTSTLTDVSPVQSDPSPPPVSLRVLCQQARYIVVYLDRAIGYRDFSCLPRLAEDLRRISSAMPSQKIKMICNEFVAAAATEDWSSIQLLHAALKDELFVVTEGSAGSIELAKAG